MLAFSFARTFAACAKWSVICVFFQAEDGIRVTSVTGVQTCALPISICMIESLWFYPVLFFAGLAILFLFDI